MRLPAVQTRLRDPQGRSPATSRTVRPDATRSRARRRNSGPRHDTAPLWLPRSKFWHEDVPRQITVSGQEGQAPSGTGVLDGSGVVVRTLRRRVIPTIPWARTTRATRLWLTLACCPEPPVVVESWSRAVVQSGGDPRRPVGPVLGVHGGDRDDQGVVRAARCARASTPLSQT